jgi:hypothetical protein
MIIQAQLVRRGAQTRHVAEVLNTVVGECSEKGICKLKDRSSWTCVWQECLFDQWNAFWTTFSMYVSSQHSSRQIWAPSSLDTD